MKVTKKLLMPVAELLDVGVLVGRALVAVDGDALVDDLALEVHSLPSDSMTSCWR